MELIVIGNQREVIDRCRVCKKPRHSNDRQSEWERHLIRCMDDNRDRIVGAREKRNALMKPWDPEYAAYIQDPVRAAKILRGELKP